MTAPAESLVILVPGFTDREALAAFLRTLDRAFTQSACRASVLIVDEIPREPSAECLPGESFHALDRIEILKVRSGAGPQRALALGLYHVHEYSDAQAVIVMRGDAGDRAEELPQLLKEFENGGRKEIVFGIRPASRLGLTYGLLYQAYRAMHRLLTGSEAQTGFFSVLPRDAMNRLMANAELWNHYASAVHRGGLPCRQLQLAGGGREEQPPRPGLVSLFMQGLTAMAVFSDRVSVRLLTASAVFAGFALGIIVLTASVAVFTGFQISGWATYAIGLLLAVVLQPLTFAILFAFLVASRRSAVNFILQRDAPYFILGKTAIQAPNHSEIALQFRTATAGAIPGESLPALAGAVSSSDLERRLRTRPPQSRW